MQSSGQNQEPNVERFQREMALLYETSLEINSQVDISTLLQRIVERGAQLLGVRSGGVYMTQPDGRSLLLVTIYNLPGSLLKTEIRIGEGIAGHVLKSGKPIQVSDYSKWDERAQHLDNITIRRALGVPFKVRKQVIGVLVVNDELPGKFNEGQIDLLSLFADQAAIALENARLLGETRRRVTELEAVNRISQAIATKLDLDDLCNVVGDNIAQIFDVEVVYVAIYDHQTHLVHTPYFLLNGQNLNIAAYPLGQGLTSVVIQTRKPLLINEDAPHRATDLGAVLWASEMPKSWLGVPMLVGDEVTGVLSVQSYKKEGLFTDSDVRLLSTIATTVGVSIQNARLYAEAQRRASEMFALAEIGREISSSLDLNTVLERIASCAQDLLTRDTSAVYLLSDGDSSMKAVTAIGVSAAEVKSEVLPIGIGIVGHIARTGSAEIINNTHRDPRGVEIQNTPPTQENEKLMAAPLISREIVIGVMVIWRGAQEREFTRPDLDFLEGLARQAAIAIENARLFEETRRRAQHNAELFQQAQTARAEAEEANKAKSRFLANMSHELRTPLNSIINFAYLLNAGTEGELNLSQADMILRIEDAGRHLLGLINDILDLTKIEAGRLELGFEPVDLRELVREVFSTTAALVSGRPVQLLQVLPSELPAVYADRTRLRQVLLNLISNAAKFTDQGYIRIGVQAPPGDTWVTISVEDTGIGISAEDMPRMFQEFLQLDGELNRRSGGTGLGLPISKKFVELHGGRMWVESQLGAGSTFYFTLPRYAGSGFPLVAAYPKPVSGDPALG